MTTTKTLLAAAVAAGLALPASAAILDFETGFSGNKTILSNPQAFAGFGVTFASTGGLNVVQVGGPTDGFVPNDTPSVAGALGSYFLTSDFAQITDLTITYDMAVTAASFDVADIDGLQDGVNQEEIFTFKARCRQRSAGC
jgi:hypothetical protein